MSHASQLYHNVNRLLLKKIADMNSIQARRLLRKISIVCFFVVVFGLVSVSNLQAGFLYTLLDHGDGNQGTNYGLRVDNGSVQTFSFQQGAASVDMLFFTDGTFKNQAQIYGTIRHNQNSQQLWKINAVLNTHLFTDNGTDWRSDTSGDLYDDVIQDLISNGANEHSSGEMDLKDINFSADRIGFRVVTLDLTLLSGQGAAEFTLPGQIDGSIRLYDFPQGVDDIPFLLAKGHRLGTSSNEIAGIGWLDPRVPGEQNGSDGLTQDFLFKLGTETPNTPNNPVPEPSSMVLLFTGGMGILAYGRRKKLSKSA